MQRFWKSGLSLRQLSLPAVLLLTGLPAAAQQPMRMQPIEAAATGKTGDPMMNAMGQMEKGMAAAPRTGNTDQEFVAMMIPHHQGAIDMAKDELSHGKDPMLRRMAQNIISSQASQVRILNRWEAKHRAAR